MSETKKYCGVSTCVDHKTISFREKDAPSMPCKERAGSCGLCYWFDEKEKALSKTEQLIEQGYSLHRVFDYPNYYAEKVGQIQSVIAPQLL